MRAPAVLVVLCAVVAAVAVVGAAATLGVSSPRVDSFDSAAPASTSTSSTSTSSTTSTTAADTLAPVATQREFFDTNEDGWIDQVRVTYNEALDTFVGATTGWVLTNAPAGMATSPSSVSVSGPTVLLDFTVLSTTATTAVANLQLSLTSGSAVRDLAGNFAATFANQAVADKAAPAPIATSFYDLGPTNGRIDQIRVTFSETLASYSAPPSVWTAGNRPDGMPASSNGVTFANPHLLVNFSDTATEVDTAPVGLTISLASHALGVRDSAGNLTDFTDVAVATDFASPTPWFVETNDGGGDDGKPEPGDQVLVRFSEPLNPQTVCASRDSDWTTNGELDDDNQVTVTITNGTPDVLTVTATGCTGGLRFGSLFLGDNGYVSATTTFRGTGAGASTVTLSGGNKDILVVLGAVVTGGGNDVSGNRTATYSPNTSIVGTDGNNVNGTRATANEKQF